MICTKNCANYQFSVFLKAGKFPLKFLNFHFVSGKTPTIQPYALPNARSKLWKFSWNEENLYVPDLQQALKFLLLLLCTGFAQTYRIFAHLCNTF